MKVFLIDDEIAVLSLLKRYLNSFKDIEIIGEYTNSRLALEQLKKDLPDLCFLDIEMPNITGFQLIEQSKGIATQFVFTTAYSHYAVDAFKVDAMDYILKPFSLNDLERVLIKARRKLPEKVPEIENKELIVNCFGPFTVRTATNVLDWQTDKVEDVFCYFILHINKKIDKFLLCELFWPNMSIDKAKNNLYNTIYLIKKKLNELDIKYQIHNKKGFYTFEIEKLNIDLYWLNRELSNPTDNYSQLEEMITILSNDFLLGKDYEWCNQLREFYNQQRIKIEEKLFYFYVRQGENRKAVEIGKKLMMENLNEDILKKILYLLFQLDKVEMRAYYKKIDRYYLEELDIPISSQVTHFYQELVRKKD